MATPSRVERVAVIGNGIIGHGVAQLFAVAGKQVVLVGRRAESLQAALGKIQSSLERFQSHGLIAAATSDAALRRISTGTTLEAAEGSDLVIEAVTEDLPLKRDVFEQLDRICPPPTVFASSSGQPASKLVARVRHRERMVAAHFWNPPQLIPLVEVCAGPESTADVVPWLCEVLREIGKQPVVLGREIDGFIGNRLQFALLREALALWASGVASAEAIDLAVRNSFGRRLAVTGPLESADVGGLDTMHAFAAFLFPSLDSATSPPTAMSDLVARGRRGLPSGHGIYDWTQRDGEQLVDERIEELFRHLGRDAGLSAD